MSRGPSKGSSKGSGRKPRTGKPRQRKAAARKAAVRKKQHAEKLRAAKGPRGRAAGDIDALFQRAVALHRKHRLKQAEAAYKKVLDARPGHVDAINNLGLVLMERGVLDGAITCFRDALAVQPDHAMALGNLGDALTARGESEGGAGDAEEAIQCYERFLDGHGEDPAVLAGLAGALASQGRMADAAARYRRAAEIAPGDPEILVNLGNALQAAGAPDDAALAFARALAVDPDFADAHFNLGVLHDERGEADAAIESYRRAIAAEPRHAPARTNLGMVYQVLGRIGDAETCFRDALAAAPDHAPAHHNLGLVLWLQGKLADAWPEYEWRLRAEGQTPMRDYPQPLWRGADVRGKTVLVWGEQGIGDEIMFAGMVPDLAAMGASVVLECDGRLVPLFRRSFPDVRCIARRAPPDLGLGGEKIDLHVPAGGLCRWLRPDPGSFPAPRPYLAADDRRRHALRERYLDGGGDVLVGIAWHSKNKLIGAWKSMSLMDWRPLAAIPGVRFVDLQYGDTADERRAFANETGAPIVHDDAVDQMADLDAFAAQVAAMDLVVSVSNTTVHMAGALGVPTWVMLNTVPLSCWMLDRDDSPWYPSVRLYRQSTAGQWNDVVARVAASLAGFATGAGRD